MRETLREVFSNTFSIMRPVRGTVPLAYGMRCIVGFHGSKLTVNVGHKRVGKGKAMYSNHSNLRESAPNQQQLQGVSRLVIPLKNVPEVVARGEDPFERDYLGRLLHVADEALHHVKHGREHRKRRRVH